MEKNTLQAALQKQAAFGADLDLKKFDDNNDVHLKSAEEISASGRSKLEKVGIDLQESNRSATFVRWIMLS